MSSESKQSRLYFHRTDTSGIYWILAQQGFRIHKKPLNTHTRILFSPTREFGEFD